MDGLSGPRPRPSLSFPRTAGASLWHPPRLTACRRLFPRTGAVLPRLPAEASAGEAKLENRRFSLQRFSNHTKKLIRRILGLSNRSETVAFLYISFHSVGAASKRFFLKQFFESIREVCATSGKFCEHAGPREEC